MFEFRWILNKEENKGFSREKCGELENTTSILLSGRKTEEGEDGQRQTPQRTKIKGFQRTLFGETHHKREICEITGNRLMGGIIFFHENNFGRIRSYSLYGDVIERKETGECTDTNENFFKIKDTLFFLSIINHFLSSTSAPKFGEPNAAPAPVEPPK